MEFKDFALTRYYELLEMENVVYMSSAEQEELDMLETWYDAWYDYAMACDELRSYYEGR